MGRQGSQQHGRQKAQQRIPNLKKDPSESRDLIRKRPRIARRLLREMIDRLQRDNATYPVDLNGHPLLPREDAVR